MNGQSLLAVLIRITALACLLLAAPLTQATEEVWVLIDTATEKARVFRGQDAIAGFNGISIGRNGAARVRRRGDNTTPLGEFHVSRINYESRFHIFLELDYPTIRHAERALEAGIINRLTYRRVLDTMLRYGRPPQDTELGGYIGIHGIGKADATLHRRLNWTEGCVALTDQQIEKLAEWVQVGTRIVIR
ncbi:L,D-transpeptidase [Ectothiorhodospiraceae bacterium WFHF3C12]|nr:L,D-transpeptidase [Ectothiorhodospiraceae bacterium WFHF3C12]